MSSTLDLRNAAARPAADHVSVGRSDAGEPWSAILERCVERLVELEALAGDAADELRPKVASQRFDLIVAGQFKRGKISVVNALIGTELLPAAVVPPTSVITDSVVGSGVRWSARRCHRPATKPDPHMLARV